MPLLLTVQQLNDIESRANEIDKALEANDGATRNEVLQMLEDVRTLLADVIEHRYRNTGAQMMLDGRAHAIAQ